MEEEVGYMQELSRILGYVVGQEQVPGLVPAVQVQGQVEVLIML